MKSIIPAAGLGTRFLPGTKVTPKEMLPVLDKPVIQYVVEEALAPEEVDECIIVSSQAKPQIMSYFTPDLALEDLLRSRGKEAYADAVKEAGSLPVDFCFQSEPLGLGHAIYCAHEKTAGEPFYVLLGDVLVPDNNMLPAMQAVSDAHDGASVIAVMPVPHEKVDRFGVIAGQPVGENVWQVSSLVEKPPVDEAPTDLAVFGRYLLSPRVMELLEHAKPTVGGEIQLTDALDAVLKEEPMYALVVDPADGFDTGTVESWLQTNNVLWERAQARK